MRIKHLVCASAAVALGTACGASVESEPVSATSVTMATIEPRATAVPSNERAVQEIAAARCSQEDACRNLGLGNRWTSYADCTREVGAIARIALLGRGCARGIDPYTLERCLDATRSATCETPLSASVGVAPCSAMDLCL